MSLCPRAVAVTCAALLLPALGQAQSAGIRTCANPLDIDYQYNFEQLNQGISYRSGADPVIVPHRGVYYLFSTVSGGYWHSEDLIRWRYVRYEHGYVGAAHLAISNIRVFGNSAGDLPATPSRLSVRRDADRRNAFVSWGRVPGTVGYNEPWGITADKLYQTYQVFADGPNPLEIRALTVDQEYCFAIEAFNESGVSPASRVVCVR